MTELSGDQVREVQWASSEQGKAQLRAAWERAGQLGLTSSPAGHLTMADLGALLWAAREARVPDDGEVTARRAARHQLLQLIKDSGPRGISSRNAYFRLNDETRVPRETVHRWLRELEALRLIVPVRAGSTHGWAIAPAPDKDSQPAEAAGFVTVLSGCAYCHLIIVQAKNSGLPWRIIPDRATEPWQVFRNEDAIRCASSPDDRHHPPGTDSSGRLPDEPGRSALAHLQGM